MIGYKVIWENQIGKPGINFDKDYMCLNELNSCDVDYILYKVLPNLEKIKHGEFVQDPCRQDEHLVDTYDFGYDATIIDFGREKSVINYNFFSGKLEVLSEDLYQLMFEWGDYLKSWKDYTKNSAKE